MARIKLTEEKKAVLIERLAKARAAKAEKSGPPKYQMYSEYVVNLPDDDPLSLVTVKGWLKEAKTTAAGYKKAWKYGDKKAYAKYNTWVGYATQLGHYLRSGTYTSNFMGAAMEFKTQRKCIAMAYYANGRPKREIGVWYPDVLQEWTKEMDVDEAAQYKGKIK
tara:strand:+ start:3121 stop:3612 length:492 start_codon:yes stop_codon:yes gene_type:complete